MKKVNTGDFVAALYSATIETLKQETNLHGPELELQARSVVAQIIHDINARKKNEEQAVQN